jgi:phosphoglycerate dehydrogenase-like enzyme/predicted dehydrogenase
MQQRKRSSRPLRILVIGAGGMSQHTHLPILANQAKAERVSLSIICDLQHDRATSVKERFGFSEQSADARLAVTRDDIDAVYVFGTAQLHSEFGRAALACGKHIFVEKPIAPSYAEALRLVAMAGESGLVAVGGHNRRFYPSLAMAKAEAGRAGWVFIEAVFHKPEFHRLPPFGAKTWLTANGIHALDTVVYLAGGLPSHVASVAMPAGSPETRNFSAIMRWPDGCQASFLSDNSAGSRKEEYVLHNIERTCTASATRLLLETPNGARETIFGTDEQGFEAEHLAFLDAIEMGAEAPHAISALAPSLFLAELIEQGFSGPVDLPVAFGVDVKHQVKASRSREASDGEASVLVVNSPTLQTVLPMLAEQHRIVSPEEVCSSPDPRPDIRAAIIGRGGRPLDRDLLAKLPRLEIVGIAGLSLRNYGPELLFEHGVHVVNASEAYARTVAEFALGLALLGRRRAFLSHEVMRRGGWGVVPALSGYKGVLLRYARSAAPFVRNTPVEALLKGTWRRAKRTLNIPGSEQGGPFTLRDFSGVTVGLIGWSANAKAFTRLLRPFDATVKVYSEHASEEDVVRHGARKTSLREVLAADVVSLHRGLTEKTRHCLGASELMHLRPGAVLVNVARGGLIDEKALIARLRRGDISACLDTYDREPLPRSHPLRRLPNVFLTAHIAGGTTDMYDAAAREATGKVMSYLRGEAADTVSREQWAMMS